MQPLNGASPAEGEFPIPSNGKEFRAPPPAGEVHVWRLDGAPSAAALPALATVLSREERAHAERLREPDRRAGFLAARGLLRAVLAGYIGASPRDLVFVRTPMGKPLLATPATGLHFSLTHTGGLTLFAIATHAVGIDAERIRPRRFAGRIAARIFAPGTQALLERLAEPERTEAFHAAWTLREAHVKAIGGGVWATADALPFLWPPAAVCPATPTGAGEWGIVSFAPCAGVVATVVAAGGIRRVVDLDAAGLLRAG